MSFSTASGVSQVEGNNKHVKASNSQSEGADSLPHDEAPNSNVEKQMTVSLMQTKDDSVDKQTNDSVDNQMNDSVVDAKEEETKNNNESDSNKRTLELKRKKTRRSRKRRWHSLKSDGYQWGESSEHEVTRIHISVQKHGQPLAPYNTTQFIMNDHCDRHLHLDDTHTNIQRTHQRECGQTLDHEDEEFYSWPEDESDYLQQQFHEAYNNIHAERLNSMTKNELVQEYLQLEDRVEDLEKRLKETRTASVDVAVTTIHSNTNNSIHNNPQHNNLVQTASFCDKTDADSGNENEDENQFFRKAAIFQDEIKRLIEENQRLRCDNEMLQHIINESHLPVESHSLDSHNDAQNDANMEQTNETERQMPASID